MAHFPIQIAITYPHRHDVSSRPMSEAGRSRGWFWSVMRSEEWAPAGAAGRLKPPGQTLYSVDAAVGFRECSRGVKTVE